MPNQPTEYTPSTTRIEAFSDGVFAIVSVWIPLVLYIAVPLFYFVPQKIVRGEGT